MRLVALMEPAYSWNPSGDTVRGELSGLLGWVRSYRERRDEFSLSAHRRLFDAFAGPKIEHGVLP